VGCVDFGQTSNIVDACCRCIYTVLQYCRIFWNFTIHNPFPSTFLMCVEIQVQYGMSIMYNLFFVRQTTKNKAYPPTLLYTKRSISRYRIERTNLSIKSIVDTVFIYLVLSISSSYHISCFCCDTMYMYIYIFQQ